MKSKPTGTSIFRIVSHTLFPLLSLYFAYIYITNEQYYRDLTWEDNRVEWYTFGFLMATGLASLLAAVLIWQRYRYKHWFFILFFVFNCLAGLEEISWGQRVLGIETTPFFRENSDQKEINIHNTFQGIFSVKTKHIALIVLFIYGVILPWLLYRKKLNKRWFDDVQFIIPPGFLLPGFLMGSILMLDFQTGFEEEIGELFFSICFLIMMVWNIQRIRQTNIFRPKHYSSKLAKTPSFNEKAESLK